MPLWNQFCWLRADSFSIKTRLCTIIKLVWWKRVISPTESRDSKIPGDLFQGGGSLCGKFPALSVPSHWLTKSPWSFLMFYKRRTNNQPLGGTLDWTNTHGLWSHTHAHPHTCTQTHHRMCVCINVCVHENRCCFMSVSCVRSDVLFMVLMIVGVCDARQIFV